MPTETGALSNSIKLTFVATGSLAATLGAFPASAAPPAPPAKMDPGRWADAFNGWSVGIGGDLDIFRDSTRVDSFDEYSSAESPTLNGNGPFADVEFGRDFRTNNLVFGVYGDFFAGEKKGTFGSSDTYTSGNLTLKEGGSVTARAGVVANPQTLVYGLAGWTWQAYSAGVSDTYSEVSGSESGILNGPTVGVGLEMLFPNNPNVSFKTEFRYTRFDAPAALSPDGGAGFMTFGSVDDRSLRFILSFKTP